MRNSLFFSHFGAKSKACKAKKCLFKGKSIGRSQPTPESQVKPDMMFYLGGFGPWASVLCKILYILAIFGPCRRPVRPKNFFKGNPIGRSQPTSVSQVKPDLMFYLGSFGPWASVLCEILCILAIFGPYRRPARPEKKIFRRKSIGRSQATSVSQVKLDLMISLGSLGPWASILYEILYILAVLGPNQWPAGPKIFQRGQKKTGGYQKCLFIPFLLNVCAFKPLLTDIRCQWISVRAK